MYCDVACSRPLQASHSLLTGLRDALNVSDLFEAFFELNQYRSCVEISCLAKMAVYSTSTHPSLLCSCHASHKQHASTTPNPGIYAPQFPPMPPWGDAGYGDLLPGPQQVSDPDCPCCSSKEQIAAPLQGRHGHHIAHRLMLPQAQPEFLQHMCGVLHGHTWRSTPWPCGYGHTIRCVGCHSASQDQASLPLVALRHRAAEHQLMRSGQCRPRRRHAGVPDMYFTRRERRHEARCIVHHILTELEGNHIPALV